jgi:putative ABC transport system permease protein
MQVYLMLPAAPNFASLVVRSALPTPRLDSVVRAAVIVGNARIRPGELTSPELQRQQAARRPATIAKFLGGFALFAVILAAIGLHAVIAYAVKQREREIGIRIALGAANSSVARMIFGHGMKLTLVGAVVGAAGAFYATKLMRGLLFGVEPGDPMTIVLSIVALCTIAVIACAAPARRATRVDPVELVRAE